MNNPILYVIVNGELEMSPGKAAAQVVHAAILLKEHGSEFSKSKRRTVVVLEAKNGFQIQNLHTYLDEIDIWSDYYIDEGLNQVDPYSITAMVVEPIESADEEKRSLFAGFPLFSGWVEVYDTGFSSLKIRHRSSVGHKLFDKMREEFQ